MSFLLDTNILSAHLRRPRGLTHRFVQHSGRLYTSSLCMAELYAWAHGRSNPVPALAAIDQLLRSEVSEIDFCDGCAKVFGPLRTDLRRRGVNVSPIDLLIASVALYHDLTLVTHNTRDFQSVPGLRVEDWLAP